MKTKILVAGLLLAGMMQVNGQTGQVETSFETGLGTQNGAFQSSTAVSSGSTFIGYRAGYVNTGLTGFNGQNNTFIGNQAGYDNTTGYENSFFGGYSGFSNTTGYRNTFLGFHSGYSNTTADGNVYIGYKSGYSNTGSTPNYNVYIGFEAGTSSTSGVGNAFLGYAAGREGNVSYSTFIGYQAGRNTTGTGNTFIGTASGMTNTTGVNNVYVGKNAGHLATTSFENVYMGETAGYNTVGGGMNVYIGHKAGFNNTGGAGNIFIGHDAGENETGSAKLYIANTNTAAPLIKGDFTAKQLVFNGKVSITTDTDQTNLFPASVGGVVTSGYQLYVKGGILTEEVRVHLKSGSPGWADYVFAEDYKLPTIPELEKYIAKNGHLPNVPSAQQVKEDGIELGQMANIQQEKIEELTLYIIQQNKQLEQQQKEIDELKATVKALAAKQ